MVLQRFIKKEGSNVACLHVILLIFLLLALPQKQVRAQQNVLFQNVSLKAQKTSVYQLLDQISVQIGYYFIYKTEYVNNQKKVRIKAVNASVEKVLDQILQNSQLTYHIIGNHILIDDGSKDLQDTTTARNQYFTIKGRVLDAKNNTPLAYATVGMPEKGVGVIANQDGFFVLKINLADSIQKITFSHVGYRQQDFLLNQNKNQTFDIFLKPHVISIQEVVVRYYYPHAILEQAMLRRKDNYSRSAYNQQGFYREGTVKNDGVINYTEAIFDIYKMPYDNLANNRVKLKKWRKMQSSSKKDTVDVKVKAGIRTILDLDIVRNLPDFLNEQTQSDYQFRYAGLIYYLGRQAYTLEFKPKPESNETFFSGTLYIDTKNYAILSSQFHISRQYLETVQSRFLIKKSRKLRVYLNHVEYLVNYKIVDSIYYVNHVRCDIKISTRQKYSLKKSDFHTFIEFAGYSIEQNNVKKHKRSQTVKPNTVFSDKVYDYDASFWGKYNYIPPEKKLTEALKDFEREIATIRD